VGVCVRACVCARVVARWVLCVNENLLISSHLIARRNRKIVVFNKGIPDLPLD
jgi:hypothetical protein